MRFLTYDFPKIEISVGLQGETVMYVSDKKETTVVIYLRAKDQELLLQAIAAAQLRMYPEPPGKKILYFPPKNDAV